jgi:MFS family permease
MFSLTLLGDAFLSIALTSRADKWGRRKTLVLSSFFSVFTAVVFASQSNFWVLLIAAVVGVISPSANEIGPFLAVELSGAVLNSNLLSTHNILAVLLNLLFKRVLLSDYFSVTLLSPYNPNSCAFCSAVPNNQSGRPHSSYGVVQLNWTLFLCTWSIFLR